MDLEGVSRALAAVIPRNWRPVVGGAVLLWVIATDNYAVVYAFMADGLRTVTSWLGLYDRLTRIATP